MDSINYSKNSSDDNTIAYLIANDLLPGLDSNSAVKHKGVTPGKQPNVKRDFDGAYQRLMNDCFGESLKNIETLFKQKLRISRRMFETVCEGDYR